MPGEKNLAKLLASISPKLVKGEYVFCTFKNGTYGDFAEYRPIASFDEEEGLTLILREKDADSAGLHYEGVFRCITLNVYSSLNAVGLTAAISAKLSNHGISANVVAGFYHDHIFVPEGSSDLALKLLQELGS